MESNEKNLLSKAAFAGLICLSFLYIGIVQFAHAVYGAHQFVQQGKGSFPSPWIEGAFALVLWMPFLIQLLKRLKTNGCGALYLDCKEMLKKHWAKFLIYLMFVYFLKGCVTIGDLYLELPGFSAIWLNDSAGSYVLMSFCHYLFENLFSLLFVMLAPFLCYMRWKKPDVGQPGI